MQIDVLDGVDSMDDVDVTDRILEGGDVINYTLDLHIFDNPATYYVHPFWEGIQQ